MLKISVGVTMQEATVAIARALSGKRKITVVHVFKDCIREYIKENGISRLYHDSILFGQYMGEARELCNKYYNK